MWTSSSSMWIFFSFLFGRFTVQHTSASEGLQKSDNDYWLLANISFDQQMIPSCVCVKDQQWPPTSTLSTLPGTQPCSSCDASDYHQKRPAGRPHKPCSKHIDLGTKCFGEKGVPGRRLIKSQNVVAKRVKRHALIMHRPLVVIFVRKKEYTWTARKLSGRCDDTEVNAYKWTDVKTHRQSYKETRIKIDIPHRSSRR